MKTYLDCYVCLMRQALTATRQAGLDDDGQRAVVLHVLSALQEIAPGMTPPVISDRIHTVIREQTGNEDPYHELKERSTQEVLALYPRLAETIRTADDPFVTAVRLAIAGNVIDVGPADEHDVWGTVQAVLSKAPAVDDTPALRDAIGKAEWILYLADNAGETVFDRLLIEQIAPVPVVYAVKGGAVVNDATEEDALAAGLGDVAQVVSTGSRAPGTVLESCSDAFRAGYNQAPVIIAKGMGNYETLSTEGERLFFLFLVKCEAVAADVGVPVKSVVIKRG